jgi:YD repeat-containing protein
MFYQPNGAGTPAPNRVVVATLVFLVGTAFTLPAAGTTTVAGRTAGSFAVSPTGAATYAIPIWAPPGPNGMQPHIALTYNSQQGNGYVGVGWGVSGLSSIYRCNLTYAQDAAPAPVALVTSDGYCMDGQRLRLTGGTYGTAGSTYQTEVANFINVTAYGTAGNGPSYWIAQDRNGRSYTYGNGGDSQVIAAPTTTASAWMLNEVSDPAGNTMTVAYNTTTGSPPCVATAPPGAAVPCTISWTPSSHGSSSYNYTMNFVYGANKSQSSLYAYTAGTAVTNSNLLSSITIEYSGATVKKYVLTYQASPTTGRDELTQVQECSDSGGTNCLLPTAITYQNGAAGVSTTATSLSGTTYAEYDFDGNGFSDLFYANGTTYYVAFGSATGYGTPVNTGISTSSISQILFGDLLGNGSDGILVASGGTWYYYTWNGSSFTKTSTGLAYDSTAVQYLLADVNGDGLPALIAAYFTQQPSGPGTLSTFTVNTLLNTGAGSSVSFGSAIQSYQLTSYVMVATPQLVSNTDNAGGQVLSMGGLRRFDFNGDGRDDLAMQTITKNAPACSPCTYNTKTYELISGGSTSSPTLTAYQLLSASGTSLVSVAFLDFNSDACTDYLAADTLYIAGCNGSAPSTISLGSANVIGAMDWDGDGRTDILVQNGSTIGVYLSTGDGLSTLVSTSIPYSSSNSYFTFKPAGYGQDALGYWTSSGGYYYPHNGLGTPPDLVSSITDGYGNSASPTYVSIVQSDYTKYTSATYPDEDYIGPLYVVSSATFSDPSSASGGTYYHTYGYFGATTNLQGRGFEAFYETTDYDSRNGLEDRRYFERSFPYTGMQSGENVYSVNLKFDPTYGSSRLASLVTLSSMSYQERYFGYFSNVTDTVYEVGGTESGDLITTTSTNYTLDNYGNPTSITKVVTDNDPNSPYLNQTWTTTTTNTTDVDTTHWCLGLFTETQVAYSSTVTGSGSVTRTKTMTPDTTNCRYTQIVTEPSSSQFKVTEALGYDSFGNVNSDTVTGINMTARTTSTSWTNSSVTTGQFPMSVTDPTSATTQYNYNLSYGLKSSVTDPNNETTSWAYTDGFGRLTQETRPDGTYTVYSYSNCASTSGCLVGTNGLNVGYDVYGTNAALITYGGNYYDSVNRQVMSETLMLSGSISRTDKRYDSLGRVSESSFPCVYSTFATACTYWATNSYDVLNRLTQSQRPISSTNSNLQTTTYAYAGRTTTVTDPQSNTRTTVTDVNGWLRQTKDPMGYNVTMAYDSAGSKTQVTDSLGNTLWTGTYNYGLSAYLASATDMDMGSWGFTVDALGEKTAWSDAKTQSFSETYDALSRPLTRTDPDLFTQWTWGSSASSHNIGKLQTECTGTGTSCSSSGYSESETYDSLGRRSQRSITIPGYSAFTYTWAYGATTGLLSTLTYPTSTNSCQVTLQYAYTNGMLASLTDASNATQCGSTGTVFWTANTMDPAGHVTEETLGNGIVTNRSFDAVTQWLGTAQSGVGGGAGVKNLAFLYDEMGNVTQRQDNNLGLTENIYYDNDYRFSYSKLNGTQNLSVGYDSTGNITSRSDVAAGASWTYDPNHKHEVTQAGSSSYQYSYDANGNAITRQGSTIGWSSYNYPTTINAGSGATAETVAFSYGPDRQRWQQMYTGNSTQETTNYVGGLMEVVANGSVTDYRHYINVAGEQIAVYSRQTSGTNTVSYLLSDHQASVASMTNSGGAQVVGESFDAFGSRRNPTTWSGPPTNSDLTTIAGITREGYTFQTALGLWMGINHMNGRVEDSIIGRMLSADPHVPSKSNPQSYNRYSYANDNPLTLIDPSGFSACGSSWCKPINGGSCQAPRAQSYCSVDGAAYLSNWVQAQWQLAQNGGENELLPGLLDVANLVATPIDQSQGCLIGCSTTSNATSGQDGINAPNGAPATGTSCPFGAPGQCGAAVVTNSVACGGLQCSYQMGPYNVNTLNGPYTGVWIQVSLPTDGGGQWVQTYSNCFFTCSPPQADTPNGQSFPPFWGTNYSDGQTFYDDPARPSGTTNYSFTAQTSYVQPGQNGATFTLQWGFTLSATGSVGYTAPVAAPPSPQQQQQINSANSLQQAGPH